MDQDAAIDLRALSSTPELDLVERHRYGDPDAFDEIYRRFESMVYNLCLRMSGSASDAEDLAQEVFLRIHRHLGRFNGRSSLKTWVYRVTLNLCRSKLGRKRWPMRTLKDEDDEGGVELVATGRGPEDRAVDRDAARRVLEALDELPRKFREAVVLRDLEDLSYEEIAEVLGVRIGTVRSRISRGRDRLRRLLPPPGDEEGAP
ncbi:MAG: sigma-70 family RNA polymerase sigma factor [Acidobacteriota bacterium]